MPTLKRCCPVKNNIRKFSGNSQEFKNHSGKKSGNKKITKFKKTIIRNIRNNSGYGFQKYSGPDIFQNI
jgi:hypothetical protein